MGIGFSILLLAAGAILAFAVKATTIGGMDVSTVGYILMAAGVIGLLWSIFLVNRSRRLVVVDPRHSVADTVVTRSPVVETRPVAETTPVVEDVRRGDGL
jgi:hypothetical protein